MPVPSDYNSNIPQSTNQVSISQGDLLNNFGAIQALIDVNHVDFAAVGAGKHKWVTMPQQGATPPAGSGFIAGELGVYNAVYSLTSNNELFINKTNQVTVVQVPSTASVLSTNSSPAQNTAGWTTLPSGIILRWGSFTGITGLGTVTLATSAAAGPALTQILSVQVTTYDPSTSDVNFVVRLANIISPTQFNVYVSSRTSAGSATGGFQFLVIGY